MSVIPAKLLVILLVLLTLFTEVELGCGAVDKSQGIFNSISDPLLDSCFHSDPIDDLEKQSQEDACKSLVDIYKAYTEQVLNREETAQIPFWPWQDKEENVVPNTANSLYVEETFDDITDELTESKDELLTRLQDLKQELQNQRSKLDAQRKNYLEAKEKAVPVGIKINSFSGLQKDEKVVQSSADIIALQESKANLAIKMGGSNQNLQNSGLELANQVKTYLTDLAHLKKHLKDDLEQLKTDYQDLISNLQQQHDDLTANMIHLGDT